jgi:hypothetical protein
MAPYYDNPGQKNDEAISVANGKTFQVIQLADSEGKIINPASGELILNGDIVIGTEIEISNDAGNPIPVSDNNESLTIDSPAIGEPNTATATSDTGTFPILALFKRLLEKITTLSGYVDGVEGTLTTIDTDTGSIDSKLPALSSGRIPVDAGEVEIKNDSGNPIPTLPAGIIDAGNGYSGTLTVGQVFTGTGIEVAPKYGTISVCIFSSHASASLGLKFQASIDNVNWETIEQYNYLAGSGLESYSFSPSGRYFRLQYTNGATETTKTAIFTVLRSGYAKSSSHRIGDTISPEKDAELVKAVLAAQKPNGIFTDINATAGGNLKISLEEVNGIDPIPVTGPLTNTELRAAPVSTAVPVRIPTTTSVASSATSVTILASNTNRRGFSISNISTSKLYLSFSTPATTANAFIEVPPGAFLLLDQQLIVGSAIYGIWAAANGTAQVTEYV